MDQMKTLREELARCCPALELREQEPMSRHTSFHIGGPAALMALPKSREEAACAVRTAAGLGIAPFFMGNGSNLLAADGEIPCFAVLLTGLDALEWICQGVDRGAGEVVVNSIDTDGVRGGFDLDMLNFVCSRVKIPVIASGGCGSIDHFSEVFEKTASSAALAASLFHFGELTVDEVKEHLRQHNIPVRTSARA